jgi:hypothetical protein
MSNDPKGWWFFEDALAAGDGPLPAGRAQRKYVQRVAGDVDEMADVLGQLTELVRID